MLRKQLLTMAVAFATALAVPVWLAPAGASVPSGTTSAHDAHEAHGSATTSSSASESDHGAAVDWKTMDEQMAKRDKSFPAATKGEGGKDLAPTVLADGTKEFHLTAAPTKWEVEPGKIVDAFAFNGTVPGPTIHVNVGDKVKIVVENQLPESTSVHWHGMQVPNDMDGVPDVTQDPIQPGKSFTYTWDATRPMVTWYHSHHNGTKQVTSGLYGGIEVGDIPTPNNIKPSQVVLMQVQDAGTIGMTINGKSFPATKPIDAHLGDWVEITYINVGTMEHPMHLHGVDQLVIAKDGFPLPAPYKADTVPVSPGERYTVLVHADAKGTWAFHCHIFPHSEGSQGMFGLFTLMRIS
ncbi:copper oxidase [Micromonospora solifontis]|uniref:Copper oxidase n=1 Tax=Micromonospora solifontis TaxID=2487138 RepID=A0ABX9WHS7_9ACTN|nr:copper oxidase [Micromonospora solifontis]